MGTLKRVRRTYLVLVLALGCWLAGYQTSAQRGIPPCNTPGGPFCDAVVPAPTNWKGPLFRLSQGYPNAAAGGILPWTMFEPEREPNAYAWAVLKYFYEGNLRADAERSFDQTLPAPRRWYHAPWQDFGTNGREPLHGLTRERSSRPKELGPLQASLWNNYAVGFYNDRGGIAIGRVWANHGQPNPALSAMPEGTVATKLLFTTASIAEVPFLRGAPQWLAYVYANPHVEAHQSSDPRAIVPLRLLQIDIAVKDSRVASKTGWVFGTFVYGGANPQHASAGWLNVAPVGLMWGNDPSYTGTGPLKETALNPSVKLAHYGYQGRLNGPVDNPRSACLSCHSTAEIKQGEMLPPNGANPALWFRNLQSGTAFTPGAIPTDYSLQLSTGIMNFLAAQTFRNATPQMQKELRQRLEIMGRRPLRDGGVIR